MLRAKPQRPKSLADLLEPQLMTRLSQLDVASRKVFAGKMRGERKSKRRGESVEFAEHRPYAVGDDVRHIDWNIYGRLDRLFLKMFLADEDLSLGILIDATPSMDCGEPSKFRFAQQTAAALAYIGLVNLNRVTLNAIGSVPPADEAPADQPLDPIAPLRNLRGRRRLSDVERWVCTIDPTGPGDFTETARRIALSRTGRGVMVVISDFMFKKGYEQGLRYLSGRGFDLVVIQVLSPQEVDPTGSGAVAGDLRLRDVEDGERCEVTLAAPLVKRYKAGLAAYCDQLREFCARRDIAMMAVQSDLAIDTLLLDYMRTRGVLR
ncbi:MAG: DUF58 domain-containing protein [Phycisphaerales bacterium]|nr:DUF58 domain-containing protein [Phycisphaerales bacterium]